MAIEIHDIGNGFLGKHPFVSGCLVSQADVGLEGPTEKVYTWTPTDCNTCNLYPSTKVRTETAGG